MSKLSRCLNASRYEKVIKYDRNSKEDYGIW